MLLLPVGGPVEEDLGYVEEEYTLFCHICDQRFSSRHNRKEHLAGRVHLKNLESELRKQLEPKRPPENTELKEKAAAKESKCCKHCVKKLDKRSKSPSIDVSLDINSQMESFLAKNTQREIELQMLRESAKHLKDMNSQLSKELITTQVYIGVREQRQFYWMIKIAINVCSLLTTNLFLSNPLKHSKSCQFTGELVHSQLAPCQSMHYVATIIIRIHQDSPSSSI